MVILFNIGRNLFQFNNTNHISNQIKVRYFKPPVCKEKALVGRLADRDFLLMSRDVSYNVSQRAEIKNPQQTPHQFYSCLIISDGFIFDSFIIWQLTAETDISKMMNRDAMKTPAPMFI